ncbi:UNVERIFIED_CONTAM: hypothetical protein Scaly_3053800 [Sesamum calycinum]|uniref:Uncharacterized protein n=1 Tax=Sesamum calycinum TaxID=2727403 RepID=A0AAW2K0N5_9LAMI
MSMVELTNIRQGKNKLVFDYINLWHALSLNCKDKLFKASAIEMCIQCMYWALAYILHGIKPRKFQKLAILTHDMECITNHKFKFPIGHQKKKSTKDEDFSEPAAMQSMAIKTTLVKFSLSERSEGLKTIIHHVTKVGLL